MLLCYVMYADVGGGLGDGTATLLDDQRWMT